MLRCTRTTLVACASLWAACARPSPTERPDSGVAHAPRTPAAMIAVDAGTGSAVHGTGWIEDKAAYTFVDLPAGEFRMGCNDDDPDCLPEERPVRRVAVAAFAMGRLEVSVKQFAACASAGACPMAVREADVARVQTCNWKHERWDHPINCLDWSAARSFCKWLGGDLPTAEQWEYAARSGGNARYPWGDAPFDATRGNSCGRRCLAMLAEPETFKREGWYDTSIDDGFGGTAPVGSFPRGATPWGLLDMAGNVVEWTVTRFDASTMELRGGSWDGLPRGFRNSYRDWFDPSGAANQFGLRCAHASSGRSPPAP